MAEFSILGGRFHLDGEPFVIRCGEIHYPRVPREYWGHRLAMARAMGLNAVCLYLFWNHHEAAPGVFDFSGGRDVAAFCEEAASAGLKVILRPGPYSCAEWDFGGFPARLLREPGIGLRSSDPRFLEPALEWLRAASAQLAGLQITRGGPILAVQVENEYGAFGNDHTYLRALSSALREGGFDVPFFRCDWTYPAMIVPGHFDDDVAMVANFGSDAEGNLTRLRAAYPEGPLMCGEFWMGWFDWFGKPRNGGDAAAQERQVVDLEWMLAKDASFSLYMFHGGTNFGFSGGANEQDDEFKPYVTSYDFFAPVTEQGRATPKYFAFRERLARFSGEALPEPPPPVPVMTIAPFDLTETAPMLVPGRAPDARRPVVACMEELGQSHGCILYRTELRGRAAGEADLRVLDVHDHARVYLNGRLLGTLDRRLKESTLRLAVPADGPVTLEILVEAMGRVNFGHAMAEDRKGITRRVEFGWLTLLEWEIECHPLDRTQLGSVRWGTTPVPAARPAFHRGVFHLAETADTHLDLRGWGKGHVWVNGRHLGRYWSIGPQQTLYVPAPWLRAGRNEVVVLDLENRHPEAPKRLAGLDEPVLDEVHACSPEAI